MHINSYINDLQHEKNIMKHFTVCVYMFQKLLIQKNVVSLKTQVDFFSLLLLLRVLSVFAS